MILTCILKYVAGPTFVVRRLKRQSGQSVKPLHKITYNLFCTKHTSFYLYKIQLAAAYCKL
jgi:hypothetical protein